MNYSSVNNGPVYPKNMDERLEGYRLAFLEKVKKWRWDDPEECSRPRGRKPKPMVKFESKPRTEGERRAAALAASNQPKLKQSKYNWI